MTARPLPPNPKLADLDDLMARFRDRFVAEMTDVGKPISLDDANARAAAVRSMIEGEQGGIMDNTLAELGRDLHRRQVSKDELANARAMGTPHGLRRLFPGLR